VAPNASTDIDGTECVQETGRWLDAQALVERCLGNRELANRVLSRFRGSLDDTLRQLDLLAEQEDWKQLARRVHRLKGEAGNVGCLPLAELASQLEEICAGGQGEPARSALKELAWACSVFQQQELCLSDAASGFAKSACASVRSEFHRRG
jgi:HPt (histidine-containing phosphotransfer) domain-containing protein